MLDTETIKNISTFVEITMQVEERLRGKYEQEAERLAEGSDELRKACCDLEEQGLELSKQVKDLEAQIEELAGQRDRQAAKIIGLTDERDRQAKQITDLKKHADSLEGALEAARQGRPPFGDKELRKKLDEAMDHIRRQGEEIDKLRAGAADPRWVPLKEKQPEWGVDVLTCSKRGTVYIAHTDGTGWKGQTGMISTPVAWMPMPKTYAGGEA